MKKKEKPNNVKIAEAILEQYKPTTVGEMQDALKDIFGPMFEAMLQGELTAHLGYDSNSRVQKDGLNRRNGYNDKILHTSTGDVEIQVPRDRDGSFEPKIVPKRKKDVSNIEDKVLAMYARGMSQRDISATIEDIYGFEVSKEMISNITDYVLDELNNWQSRPLKPCYPFIKVIYTTNAIESINASFRKVIKNGTLPNENAILKLLYLRTKELYSKWNDRPIPNWSAVRNQLLIDENISSRFLKFSV